MSGFIECAECAKKRGSPILCAGCLNNRTEIERLWVADQIIRDLLADDQWRHPRDDVYERMCRYVKPT